MFVYTLAKGVNREYLPREYVPAIRKGYQGIVERLVKVETAKTGFIDPMLSGGGSGLVAVGPTSITLESRLWRTTSKAWAVHSRGNRSTELARPSDSCDVLKTPLRQSVVWIAPRVGGTPLGGRIFTL